MPLLGTRDPPGLAALGVLGTPPIPLNTCTGIRGIDSATIDAARGMGMTLQQILIRIQVPLVLPVLAAGIRTAAIQIIATATLASYIGAGGYGVYIVNGVKLFDNTQILAGAIPVALLAMIIEVLMSWLQHLLTPTSLQGQAIAESSQPY